MAHEVALIHDQSGVNLYVVRRKPAPDNRRWNTDSSEWEALTVANWDDYGLEVSESPAGSLQYIGDLSGDPGWEWIDWYEWYGPGKAKSPRDFLIASMYGYWNGTEFLVREPSTGDAFAVVTDSDFGNEQLVRADDPTEKLRVTDGRAAADVEQAAGRPIGDVGPGNTAHLLQEADDGTTAVARPSDVRTQVDEALDNDPTLLKFDSKWRIKE